ncbi:TPA: hypothetical protein JD836_22695 [Citrobacter freundii]|uniref:hypothetical protein n=1 Tax=Citrobacter freundii TaxID=546 RepID=UPI0011B22767|nr:hypothetical protein [Citrobacter freundii]HAU6299511.1 hypothetical protein [Citrobacter freundii]
MVRVEINKITYDIGYENGIYFARSSVGQSPVGRTIDELSDGLSACTGVKKSELINRLREILPQ